MMIGYLSLIVSLFSYNTLNDGDSIMGMFDQPYKIVTFTKERAKNCGLPEKGKYIYI